jgi:hypothetical protein
LLGSTTPGSDGPGEPARWLPARSTRQSFAHLRFSSRGPPRSRRVERRRQRQRPARSAEKHCCAIVISGSVALDGVAAEEREGSIVGNLRIFCRAFRLRRSRACLGGNCQLFFFLSPELSCQVAAPRRFGSAERKPIVARCGRLGRPTTGHHR